MLRAVKVACQRCTTMLDGACEIHEKSAEFIAVPPARRDGDELVIPCTSPGCKGEGRTTIVLPPSAAPG